MLRRALSTRHSIVLAAALVPFGVVAAAGVPTRLAGPAPQGRDATYDAGAENRACESCHVAIAAEWRGSLHHASWDDPVFLSAYAIEPTAFCRSCHAPEADPDREASEAHRRLGVGCVTCHVADGEVVGVRAVGTAAPHAVRGDARMGTPAACASCHQFAFPEAQSAAMQSTIEEHRASPDAARSCQSCHMKTVRGPSGVPHRSHDFRVAGDEALLRSAVTSRAVRAGDDAVIVTLATKGAGHAVPTGDMFRRLEVRAHTLDGDDVATPVVLARRFVVVPGATGPRRIQVGDDRLPASGAPRDVRLTFAAPIAGREVAWSVVYQRMDPAMAASFGVDGAADEITMASGVIAVDETEQGQKTWQAR